MRGERYWVIMVAFGLVVLALIIGLQQYQLVSLQRQVEILGLEADVASAYMRDQNNINAKLVEKIVMLEQAHETYLVP